MFSRTTRTRLIVGGCIVALFAAPSAMSEAGSTADWTTYLHDNQHSSFNAGATTITPANASGLNVRWQFQEPSSSGRPPSFWLASPTVYGGAVYVGSNSGIFYKLDEATGTVLWSVDLGSMPNVTCRTKGMLATAAVAPDPSTGQLMVYVGGGDGNVDALKASDGSVMWKSPVDTNAPGTTQNYDFSSPMVANGHIYEGMSSSCDHPLDRGGLAEIDQETGARQATYYTVPAGSVGGSIWSTPAITPDGSTIFVTTGNGDPTTGTDQGDSVSIVALDATTLAKKDIWTIPASQLGVDDDFGGSPTLFTANVNGTPTAMVGAINKNGFYYVWKQNDLAAGPVWSHRFGGKAEVAAAVWDGSHLYIAGGATKIGGVKYAGGVREINPDNGTPLWETGVAASGLGFGSPTLDGGGVLAVPTYNPTNWSANVYYLVDASTGAVLRQFPLSSPTFPQPVFANDLVFISDGATLYAYGPGATPVSADISLHQQASASSVTADQPVTYTITATNTSATTASGEVLNDALPAGVQQGAIATSQGACNGTGTITCSLGSISPGNSATITITVTPIAPGNVTNSATMTPSDATPADDTATTTVTALAESEVSYVSVSLTGFKLSHLVAGLGSSVQWNNVGAEKHSVTDAMKLGCSVSACPLFDSGLMPALTYSRYAFTAAGSYDITDAATGKTANVAVQPTVSPGSGTTSTNFTVTWATQAAPAGYVYDVQVTSPASTAWKSWLTGTTTPSGPFSSANPFWAGAGTYEFRSRLRNVGTGMASHFSHKVPLVVT
jgi:uncharacterized repeat protein (TIGR01451 family)